MALAVQLTAHFGAGAPEALLPLGTLVASAGALAAIAADWLWMLGGGRPDPRRFGDSRLSAVADRPGVSIDEAAVQAIDAGVRQLNAKAARPYAAAPGPLSAAAR